MLKCWFVVEKEGMSPEVDKQAPRSRISWRVRYVHVPSKDFSGAQPPLAGASVANSGNCFIKLDVSDTQPSVGWSALLDERPSHKLKRVISQRQNKCIVIHAV